MNKEALLEKAEKEEKELEKDLQSDEESESEESGSESDESDNDNENDDEVPASVRRQRWFSDPMFSNLKDDSSSEDESRRSEKRELPLADRLRAYSRRVCDR